MSQRGCFINMSGFSCFLCCPQKKEEEREEKKICPINNVHSKAKTISQSIMKPQKPDDVPKIYSFDTQSSDAQF